MQDLPEKITETLEALKKAYPSPYYVVVRKINGKYYAYKDVRPWDTNKKHRKSVSEYLGRIREDGAFIKKATSESDEIENAKALIISHGGKVYLPEENESNISQTRSTDTGQADLKILTILSMNARASVPFISKQVGLPASTAENRIRHLESKYGINYITEIDVSKFGYLGYMAFVKFRNKMPSLYEIHDIFDKEPHVQLVLLTTGRYDMIIYFVSDSHKDVAYYIYGLKTQTRFSHYPANWYLTPHYASTFFLPLRDEFFELLSQKVWHKTKEGVRPGPEQLTEREFNLLKELNSNGAVSFTDIDARYGQSAGASRYTYLKLKEKDIIKRVTMTMRRLPIKYHAVFLTNSFDGARFSKTRPNFLLEIIKQGHIINKYVHQSDIGIPAGTLLIMPVFDEDQVKETEDFFEKKIGGVSLRKLIVTDVVLGSLAYRRFDTAYTNQYRILVEDYKILEPRMRIEYDPEHRPSRAV